MLDRVIFIAQNILNFLLGLSWFVAAAIMLGLLILYFLAPRMTFLERIGRKRKNESRRTKESQRASAERAKIVEQEEFVDAMGVPKSRYRRLAIMVTIIIFTLSFAPLQSLALSLILALSFYRYRMGQASTRLMRLRAGLLADEVLPMARTLASSLSTGMSLTQSLSDATRGNRGKPSPLKVSIRRALADARGLEEGLREEEGRARQDLIKEFFEILADGATVARNQAATADTLDKFADINQRQRTQYQLALRVTGQARGTRTMLVAIIPFVMAGSALVSGPDLMLRSLGGQVVITAVFAMVMMAIGLTNRIINSVTKGF